MSTNIRAEISSKSHWFIGRERYYELKHFCMQYPDWKRSYGYLMTESYPSMQEVRTCGHGCPTETKVLLLANYSEKIDMVEKAAMAADEELAPYILLSVTQGVSYSYLYAKLQMPAGKDMFYDRYRKFFYLLSEARN